MAAQADTRQGVRRPTVLRGSTLALLLLLIALAVAPLAVSNYLVGALTEMLILGIFALSLGFLMGYPKLISLGHAAFFGGGAYIAGILATRYSDNLLLTLGAAVLFAALLALLIGALSLRSVGVYFLMITLALAQMVYVVAEQWVALTGGSNGLVGIPRPELFDLMSFNRRGFYYTVLVLATLAYLLLRVVMRSPFGQVLIGIGSNEERLRAVGYRTSLYKLAAFVLAGALAGAGGALWAHYSGIVAPSDVHWSMSAKAIIMVIVGGAGTLFGPILGAALVWLLESELRSYTERATMITGLVFIVFVLFLKGGVMGLGQTLWRRVRR